MVKVNDYILNINNFRKTTIKKPKHGFHIKGIFLLGEEKYLIKNLSTHTSYKNEICILIITQIALGKQNSIQSFLVRDDENNTWYLASKFMENTTNLYENLENPKSQFDNQPKNFISSTLLSIILNNININSGNILIDQNNKFYLVDPSVLSQNNPFNVDINSIKQKTNALYRNFIYTINKENLKENLAKLFIECYKIYNNDYYKPLLQLLENTEQKQSSQSSEYLEKNNSQEKVDHLKKLLEHNDILINRKIYDMIESLTLEDIIQEISLIKGMDNQQKEEMAKVIRSFETIDDRETSKKCIIHEGYVQRVINEIEELKNIQLGELNIQSNFFAALIPNTQIKSQS